MLFTMKQISSRGRRYFFLVIKLFSLTVCVAQGSTNQKVQPFQLNGTVIGRDTGRIILWVPDTSGKWMHDTAFLKNGRFVFKGLLKEPQFAHLIGSSADGNYSDFYLEPGNQVIELEENKFRSLKMKGSRTQMQSDSMSAEIKELGAMITEMSNKYSKLISGGQMDSSVSRMMEEKLQDLKGQLQELANQTSNLVKIQFIASHPDSYVSPTELLGMVNHLSLNATEQLFNSFTSEIKGSRAGVVCQQEIDKKKRIQTGTTMVDFTAQGIDDKMVSLSQFKGRYVLLDFWASWCVPCRQSMPHLKELYNQYHGKGFEILGISIDKKKNDWVQAVRKDQIDSWYQVLSNDVTKQIFQAVQLIPTQLLIDPSGRIIWNSTDDNKKTLEDVLSERVQG